MPFAQPGLFALGTRAHHYLELQLLPGADPGSLVAALAGLAEPRTTVGGANVVVGIRPSLWRAVAPAACPPAVDDMIDVIGADGYTIPSTQRDAWVWVAGAGTDVVLDVARATAAAVAPVATLVEDIAGFAYRDSRDLTGFVDGTENPTLDEAAAVALVPDGQAGAGASVALVQRWRHDLGAFHALRVEEQEQVIGRTKSDSVELGEDRQPEDSHVSRMVVEGPDGEELAIFRRSSPWGNAADNGLVFVAFSSTQEVPARMLERMAGVGDGCRDRLTRFSTPLTGGYYLVPAVDDLRILASG